MRNNGYGVVSIGGEQSKAHRRAYMLKRGPIPKGLCILHRCDNPPCINPKHLFAGTIADNNRDRAEKGRGKGFPRGANHPAAKRRGEKHWCIKVTDAQVKEIRRMYSNGNTQTKIASIYSINSATVSRIVRNEWRKETI